MFSTIEENNRARPGLARIKDGRKQWNAAPSFMVNTDAAFLTDQCCLFHKQHLLGFDVIPRPNTVEIHAGGYCLTALISAVPCDRIISGRLHPIHQGPDSLPEDVEYVYSHVRPGRQRILDGRARIERVGVALGKSISYGELNRRIIDVRCDVEQQAQSPGPERTGVAGFLVAYAQGPGTVGVKSGKGRKSMIGPIVTCEGCVAAGNRGQGGVGQCGSDEVVPVTSDAVDYGVDDTIMRQSDRQYSFVARPSPPSDV